MTNQSIWIYIEHYGADISSVSLEMLGKARELSDNVTAVVFGDLTDDMTRQLARDGAGTIINVQTGAPDSDTEALTDAFAALIEKYHPDMILFGATHNGRDLGARLSARLDLGLAADCTDIGFNEDWNEFYFTRPTYDGKQYAVIRSKTAPRLASIHQGIFKTPAESGPETAEVILESIAPKRETPRVEVLCYTPADSEIVDDLDNAAIVVSGGRGLKEEKDLKLIEDLADALGGAVGVSKPLVDKGWADKDQQVGVTGKRIKPKLYIAAGISGAIQHVLGMQDSDMIIAINNDKEAPIFEKANYGVVGDLYDVLPKLTELVKKKRGIKR